MLGLKKINKPLLNINSGLLLTIIYISISGFNAFGQCTPDTIAPNNTLLPSIEGECIVVLSPPTTTDFCDGIITGVTSDPLIYSSEGDYTISWTFNDLAGNSIIIPQTVIVDDTTNPIPTIPSLPNINEECQVNSLTPPTATDNCSSIITATTSTDFPITNPGLTTIVWVYDDGNGNVITQNQDVIIQDITSPIPDIGNLPDLTSDCEIISLNAPTATDNCSGLILGATSTSLPIITQGTTTIIWSYDDGNGNISTQNQNIIITDVTAPVPDISTLSDVNSVCEVTSLNAPSASDNCSGSILGTTSTIFPITTQGITTVIWTYDDGNGNFTTQSQNVIINDNVAPVVDIANLPPIIDECSITSLTAPTATDNCVGSITATHNVILPISIQGTTIITWTYNDGNGNIETQIQEVIINDITPPEPTDIILPEIIVECSLDSLINPTVTDNCNGFISITNDANLPLTSIGNNTITWIYTDAVGNSSAQTQNVLIQDITPPVVDILTLPPIIVDCELVSLITPIATDNCGGDVIITNDAELPIMIPGDYVITWTFTDNQGNSTIESQDVTINLIEECLELVTVNDVITPNGDGYNDYWVLENISYTEGCNVKIFNRWGAQVFETNNYDNTWEGKSNNGEILPEGVYYYIIQCYNNISFKGHITVIR